MVMSGKMFPEHHTQRTEYLEIEQEINATTTGVHIEEWDHNNGYVRCCMYQHAGQVSALWLARISSSLRAALSMIA